MPVNVHLSGSTTARVFLAAALLFVVLCCALGLLLWFLWPVRTRQLFGALAGWTRTILETANAVQSETPGPVVGSDVIELDPRDNTEPPPAA